MSDAKAKSWWVLGRGGLAVGLVLGMGLAGVTSCLGPNRGHCLYAGGDLECGTTEICVFAPTGGEAEGVGADGCFDGSDPPSGFFHAKHGLPARLRAEGDPMDVASVEGLLRRLDGCDENVSEHLASFENDDELGTTVRCVVDIRRKLTTGGGVVKSDYDVDVDEGESDECVPAMMEGVVKRYYEEIDELCPGSTSESDTSTSMETESVGTTTDEATSSSGDTTEPKCPDVCPDPARPVCDPETGMCTLPCSVVPMPDMACAEAYPEHPLCVEGQCVQCAAAHTTVCTALGFVCDVASGECVPCTDHAQCASGACELAVGTCFPDDFVVHVDGDERPMPPMLFETVADAVAAVPGTHGVIVVHELDGAGSYQTAEMTGLRIDAGKTIALLAAPDETPIIQGTGSNPGLRVEDEGTVAYVEGLTLANNASGLGLSVTDATAWVGRSRIVQNAGGGIVAEGESAVLMLHNSFVGANGAGGVGSYGIEVNGAEAHVLYTTVARNDELTTDSIRCMDATVDVRNSIVVGRDASSIECPGIVITNSALDEDVVGNVNVGAAVLAWFESATTGDFHLTPMGAMVFADIAVWQSGDPLIDIDGDRRPSTDGAFDYPGADVP